MESRSITVNLLPPEPSGEASARTTQEKDIKHQHALFRPCTGALQSKTPQERATPAAQFFKAIWWQTFISKGYKFPGQGQTNPSAVSHGAQNTSICETQVSSGSPCISGKCQLCSCHEEEAIPVKSTSPDKAGTKGKTTRVTLQRR